MKTSGEVKDIMTLLKFVIEIQYSEKTQRVEQGISSRVPMISIGQKKRKMQIFEAGQLRLKMQMGKRIGPFFEVGSTFTQSKSNEYIYSTRQKAAQ